MTTKEQAEQFLGKRVRVWFDTVDQPPARITEGKLLGLGEGGDFEVLEDDGLVHYCWPLLRIEEVIPFETVPFDTNEPKDVPCGSDYCRECK